MRHWKIAAAVAALTLTLGVLYLLGQSARDIWQELGRAGEQIGLTDDYTLPADHDGDLVIFASSITLPAGYTISGDAALVSNWTQIDAQIDGDLSASASLIVLGPAAHVGGDASLTGESVTVDGVIDGSATIHASTVTLGPASQLNGAAQVCGTTVVDNRVGAAALRPCQATTPQPANPLWAASPVSALLALAGVLAVGVLAAVPHLAAPLRMDRIDAGLRLRPTPRLLSGIVVLGLWCVLGVVLLFALSGGWLTQTLFVLYLGVSLLFGLLLIWLGLSLAGLWLGRPLLRLVRKPNAAAPWAALTGGLIISLALTLVGLTSTFGLAGLALLTVLGLAAISASRASGAAGDLSRQTSYFVQG